MWGVYEDGGKEMREREREYVCVSEKRKEGVRNEFRHNKRSDHVMFGKMQKGGDKSNSSGIHLEMRRY